ncbi:hypothetical protein DPM33_05015 [Mesorhizobium hawassense]|uniref:Uncharacterized protein n=1 Tax=Mesorhizobium hawassense TaxID=1209954 RepID=A0A330HW19_9HYPH|nr:hypothetical protein [Mesorhizobium hawassense]RAZ91842.1 hypothetical protein DPM33_05015 [Mesorhizobium hawassense]
MTIAVRPPRILDKAFEDDLLAGPLKPFLELIQRDRDLIAEIRSDLLDVYCKGQRLVSIRPTRQGSYLFESHEKFWPQRGLKFSTAESVASFCRDNVPFIKQRIAEHGARGLEIEFEQLLVRANNLETLNTDYIAVDRQGISEEGRGRTDVVGVYWPGNRRGSGDRLAPALIEVNMVSRVASRMSQIRSDATSRICVPFCLCSSVSWRSSSAKRLGWVYYLG